MLRSILEKNYELRLDLHLLLNDFKQVYESINITYLYETLKEFGIPKKLVNLIKNDFEGFERTSENLRSNDRSIWPRNRFETRSCTVYNTVQLCAGGDKEYRDQSKWKMFNRTRQYIAYADDVLIRDMGESN
jgi:hypothetical protein